jgi:putative membrane protein (TIGR04086 family)
MSELNYVDNTINFKVMFKGIVIGLALLLLVSVIMALVFSLFAVIKLERVSNLLLITNYVIVIYIGIYVARRINSNGWLNGGLCGLIYMGIILVVGFVILPFSIVKMALIMISGLIGGGLGGVIGINI